MPESAARPGTSAAITFAVFCAVVIVASGIRVTGNLNGPLGFVFFLLEMVTPVFLATGTAMTVWRLTPRLVPYSGVLGRLFFVLAAFVVTCGSGPLAISLAVMAITRHDASIGAAGIWALLSLVVGAGLSTFGIAITLLRLALNGRQSTRA